MIFCHAIAARAFSHGRNNLELVFQGQPLLPNEGDTALASDPVAVCLSRYELSVSICAGSGRLRMEGLRRSQFKPRCGRERFRLAVLAMIIWAAVAEREPDPVAGAGWAHHLAIGWAAADLTDASQQTGPKALISPFAAALTAEHFFVGPSFCGNGIRFC